MGLGEIPGGNLDGYWKLEGLTDSSGKGQTLTNTGSVTFTRCKFTDGADFSSSGTGKGLTYGSNIFASTTPDEVFFAFWYKLNNISSANTNATFFNITSKTSATNGRQYSCTYTISGGNITISANRILTAGSDTVSLSAFTADTDPHLVIIRYSAAADIFVLSVYDKKSNLVATNTSTSTTTGGSNTNNPTIFLAIGNSRAVGTAQAWAVIEEFIVSEALYTETGNAAQRIKYRTQTRMGTAI